MAAGQQKKRLNASSIVSCNLQEQYRAKKKKNVESSQNLLNMRAHISLEWDVNQKRAVAKREQIGITWRDLSSFIYSVPHCRTGLADVLAIPQEILGLGDMTGVLSYEVWETHLSETERNLLTWFLPKGTDAVQVVQALLTGENLHFGNPSLKWGASLCSGNLHPDAVLRQEQCFKANKKAYYSELQKYHNDIVENLQKWKERWESCKDPEKDIVQKMWRKGFMKNRSRNSPVSSEGPKVAGSSRKEEKPHKLNIHSGDGAKYMSYFKISRKQHQLVKRINQSGDGIQSKCLNHVLGDVKSFHVQSYEAFEEEERKNLHAHWLQLANRDLPSAFANWTERQLQRQQWRRSLEQEMAGKMKPVVDEDEEKENPDSLLQEQRDNGDTYHEATVDIHNCEDDEESAPHSTQRQPLQRIPSLNGHHKLDPIYRESEEGSQVISKPEGASSIHSFFGNMNPAEHAVEREVPILPSKEYIPHSTHSQPLQRIPSLNGHGLDPMDMEQEDGSQDISKPEVAALTLSEFSGNMNPTKDAVDREVPYPSAKDVWPAVGIPDSFYHHVSVSHEYKSVNELSLRQPQPIEERSAHLIVVEQDAGEALLRRASNDIRSPLNTENGCSLTGSYTNQDCSKLIQPFLKEQGMLQSYPHGHKQPGPQFLARSEGLLETGHYPGHFWEQQQQLLEQRQQMRERDLYMRQIAHKNMYSGGGIYPNPSQELFSPAGVQDWAVSHVRLPAPFQSPLNGGGLTWSQGENRPRGGWSGVDVSGTPGQCLGNGNNADESLYSVLSQCSKLQSRSSYNSTSITEQYVPAKNFAGSSILGHTDVFPHSGHELNFFSEREVTAPASLKASTTSWMNLPHQSSSLHDSIGKPFLRSWNQ